MTNYYGGELIMWLVISSVVAAIIAIIGNIITVKLNKKGFLQEMGAEINSKIGIINNSTLSGQHDDIKCILKEDIKTKVENVQSIVTKEQHIREEREKNLSPQGKDFATAVEKLADYTNLLTDLTRKHDSLQRDYDNLRNENEFLKQENNELKNAMLSIDTGWQYDNPQGRGRSR